MVLCFVGYKKKYFWKHASQVQSWYVCCVWHQGWYTTNVDLTSGTLSWNLVLSLASWVFQTFTFHSENQLAILIKQVIWQVSRKTCQNRGCYTTNVDLISGSSSWNPVSLTTTKLDDCILPKFISNTIESNGDMQAIDVEGEERIAFHCLVVIYHNTWSLKVE